MVGGEAGSSFQVVRTRIRTRVSVEREIQGHFVKEIQDLTIDWVEEYLDGSEIQCLGEQKNISAINRNRIVRNNSNWDYMRNLAQGNGVLNGSYNLAKISDVFRIFLSFYWIPGESKYCPI